MITTKNMPGYQPYLNLKILNEKDGQVEANHKDQYEFKILKRLNTELNNRGMIDVLRHGIKDYGI